MHLLVATPYFPTAADPTSGTFIQRQVLAMAGRGHRIDVLHLQPRPPLVRRWSRRWRARLAGPEQTHQDGITVTRTHYLSTTQRGPLRRFQAAAVARAVGRALARRPELAQADALYAQWLAPFGWGCHLAARRAGLPTIAIARGADLNLWSAVPAVRRQLHALVDAADAVLGNGQYVRPALDRLLGGPCGRAIDVVYNPCDLGPFLAVDRDDRAARHTARVSFGLPDDAPLLLFLGQLDLRKGPDTVLDAFLRLRNGWRLVVAGGGPVAATIRARVDRLGLGGRVHFLGPVAHPRTPQLLAACDVLALPSRREGLPNVLVEALATAMPVVATPVGGSAEVVVGGRTGWLVPPDQPARLAAAIMDAHAHPEEARARGRVGRAHVRELFDVERNLDRLEAVVDRVISPRRATVVPLRRRA